MNTNQIIEFIENNLGINKRLCDDDFMYYLHFHGQINQEKLLKLTLVLKSIDKNNVNPVLKRRLVWLMLEILNKVKFHEMKEDLFKIEATEAEIKIMEDSILKPIIDALVEL